MLTLKKRKIWGSLIFKLKLNKKWWKWSEQKNYLPTPETFGNSKPGQELIFLQHISKIWDAIFWLELIIMSLALKSQKNLLELGWHITTYFLASFGLVFNWTGEKKLPAACWSPWLDLINQLFTQNVGKCGWNSSSRTFKCLKLQISLVWTFPPVTILWN